MLDVSIQIDSKVCHLTGERGSCGSTGQGEDRYFKVKFQAQLCIPVCCHLRFFCDKSKVCGSSVISI